MMDEGLTAVESLLAMGGQKIRAIKSYRERTGSGLREAKDKVDEFMVDHQATLGPEKLIVLPIDHTKLIEANDHYWLTGLQQEVDSIVMETLGYLDSLQYDILGLKDMVADPELLNRTETIDRIEDLKNTVIDISTKVARRKGVLNGR